MSEMDRIRDQLKRAFHGEAWHGPSLREVLDGVTAAQASSRRSHGHSIREIVRHISAWADICCQRLADHRVPDATPEADWPPVAHHQGEIDEASWKKDLESLFATEERLQEHLRSFPEFSLDASVPGRNHSFYVMLHGTVQHCLYHAGQIAVLKMA